MSDKVALITGASSGIGRATADAFAEKGARVALAARREDELASLVTEIEARGGRKVNNACIEGQLVLVSDLPRRNGTGFSTST